MPIKSYFQKLFSFFHLEPTLGTRITLSIGLVVGLVSLVVFISIYSLQQQQVMGRVETEAKSVLTAMVLVREWAANYGGVWTDQPGDVYLQEQNGFYRKTPAMITKEISTLSDSKDFYRFHITSLNLTNPDNAPLPSEKDMLYDFLKGHPDFGQVEVLNGERVYHYMLPLEAKQSCLECHGEQGYQVGDLRGGLSIFLPMAGVDRSLTFNRWVLISSAGLLVALLMGTLYFLIRRLVVNPIGQLETVANMVGQGNYQARCQLKTGDELESLGKAVNFMVASLKSSRDALEARVEQRTKEFAALSEIAITVSQTESLEETLHDAFDTIFKVTPADSGAIHLFTENGQEMKMVAWRGLPDTLKGCMSKLQAGQCIPARVVDAGRTLHQIDLSNCYSNGLCSQKCPLGNTNWDLISAPLKSKERILGAVTLITRESHGFFPEITQLLECVGHQLGVGIENAYFHKQTGQLAVLEERGRLARELHDNVAQTIGYLNLNTRIITDMVNSGQWQQAGEALEEMRGLTSAAYDDLRWAIFDLRAPTDEEQNFETAVRDYLDEFEVQTGLRCRFTAQGGTQLPPDVAIQLVRIVQESMHNVRKHAQAKNVWVKFINDGEEFRLSVEDDGIGIENGYQDPNTHHFGLRSMRERAESIGWHLRVKARTQGGTQVLAWKPDIGFNNIAVPEVDTQQPVISLN